MIQTIRSTDELNRILSEPSDRLIEDLSDLKGDILLLGAGGKMGPSLAMMAQRTVELAGLSSRVIAVSRFSDPAQKTLLENQGVYTISADLMDEEALENLPDASNVIFLAGTKFGTSGNECFTWAMNSYLPGRVASRYAGSRIVAFSTGNVYPLTPVDSGGADEETQPGPVGEYAQSCLGRERIFEYFSRTAGTAILIYRLNYAIDLRYGVLHEIGQAVYEKRPVDLTMGYVNVIWQGDANEFALRCLKHCTSPPTVLNVTGSQTLPVRELAERFGNHFGRRPHFENREAKTALLSNARRAIRHFGEPIISLDQMIHWTAEWIRIGGETLDKPTHFQQREGKF